MTQTQEWPAGNDVAIIGMSGRFPRAENIERFWQNLRDGVEGVSFFTDDELEVAVAPADLQNPAFVKAKGVLDEIELFDAAFFQISAREAQLMDPQQRLFLECAWSALEDAGYDVGSYPGLIAVYAGINTNTYLLTRFDQLAALSRGEMFQLMISNEKDHLATRVAYKLNLRGEAIAVQTSCSTSLVAAHLACQSLLSGQCDLALAGGVSIRTPQKTGYLYQEGMISSPDGHCRAFDRRGQGTLPGNGLGVVVLKLLSEAIKDGDHIYAVIKGSAINNDGHSKMGYTAPSIEGQADVIAKALSMAEVEPDTISFVEAHGTGTPLGDPIEVAALTRVFRQQTDRTNYCALGSVKTNIGHLDNAAGIAGLIKAVLALKHKQIPPTLHFEEPNPALGLETSPFYVNNTLLDWPESSTPRRAGVSSFGIGGTNVHMVIEEAPDSASTPSLRRYQLYTLAGKTPQAAQRIAERLADHLEKNPALDLADVAYTQNTGRQAFSSREFVVAEDRHDLVRRLRHLRVADGGAAIQAERALPVVFIFPGQGAQHPEMAKELYASEPAFRQSLDACVEIAQALLGMDIRQLIFPPAERRKQAASQLAQPEFTLPALFSIEYALAQLWLSYGVSPRALIGHSYGEYVAACFAGVFTLEGALKLAVNRGRLMQKLPEGAMTTARLSEADAHHYLTEELSVAAVNSANHVVISGTKAAVEQLEQKLAASQIGYRLLEVPFAYHSPAVETILEEYATLLAGVDRRAPSRPFISSLTGAWIRDDEAISVEYWARQMRETVRFADGLDRLAKESFRIFVEVGPGQGLSQLTKQHIGKPALICPSLARAQTSSSDSEVFFTSLGQLWKAGAKIDWAGFYGHERRHRVSLPTYPFERRRHWIESRLRAAALGENTFTTGQEEEREAAPNEERPGHVAPRNEIEASLSEIWSELLGVKQIGVHDNFFDLGGDSLLMTRVFSRIKQAFPLELSLAEALATQTIEELSQVILKALQADDAGGAGDEQPAAEYYCAFEISLEDAEITVYLTEEDYLQQSLPEGAKNFRLLRSEKSPAS